MRLRYSASIYPGPKGRWSVILLLLSVACFGQPMNFQKFMGREKAAGYTMRGKDALVAYVTDFALNGGVGYGYTFSNIWSKEKAYYPFAGTTATSQGLNFVSTSYTVTWVGSPTNGDGSFSLNGTSQACNTNLPANSLNLTTLHLAEYCSTNSTCNCTDIGTQDAFPTGWFCVAFWQSSTLLEMDLGPAGTSGHNTTSIGGYIFNVTGSTSGTIYKNGVSAVTGTNGAASNTSSSLYIGESYGSFYSNRTYKEASFGTGLTGTEAASLNNLWTLTNTLK